MWFSSYILLHWFSITMHSESGQLESSLKRTVLLMFLLLLYLNVGALVFSTIEQRQLTEKQTALLKYLESFIERHECLNSSELDDLLAVVARSSTCISNRDTAVQHRWSFTNSLFFSTTVVTTIGKSCIWTIEIFKIIKKILLFAPKLWCPWCTLLWRCILFFTSKLRLTSSACPIPLSLFNWKCWCHHWLKSFQNYVVSPLKHGAINRVKETENLGFNSVGLSMQAWAQISLG